MIVIDGSHLEGGGQILRTSVALSCITGQPCKIINIRKGRKVPGLQPQHLKGIESAAMLCNAELKNAKIGSESIDFIPNSIVGGNFSIDIGTAGAVTLVLQVLVPICLFGEKETNLEITGGTDVPWSPSIHYFKNIFLNSLELIGMKRGKDFNLEIEKYGFYPKGGGRIKFMIKPFMKFKSLDLTSRGRFERIDVISVASDFLKEKKVAERQIEGVENILKVNGRKESIYANTLSIGSSVHVHAHFDNCKLGATVLGEIGKPAERVGEEAASELKMQIGSNACFDEHMSDQILPYMAMTRSSKVSVSKITEHCKTNMHIIEKFLPIKFKAEGNIISCD